MKKTTKQHPLGCRRPWQASCQRFATFMYIHDNALLQQKAVVVVQVLLLLVHVHPVCGPTHSA